MRAHQVGVEDKTIKIRIRIIVIIMIIIKIKARCTAITEVEVETGIARALDVSEVSMAAITTEMEIKTETGTKN